MDVNLMKTQFEKVVKNMVTKMFTKKCLDADGKCTKCVKSSLLFICDIQLCENRSVYLFLSKLSKMIKLLLSTFLQMGARNQSSFKHW